MKLPEYYHAFGRRKEKSNNGLYRLECFRTLRRILSQYLPSHKYRKRIAWYIIWLPASNTIFNLLMLLLLFRRQLAKWAPILGKHDRFSERHMALTRHFAEYFLLLLDMMGDIWYTASWFYYDIRGFEYRMLPQAYVKCQAKKMRMPRFLSCKVTEGPTNEASLDDDDDALTNIISTRHAITIYYVRYIGPPAYCLPPRWHLRHLFPAAWFTIELTFIISHIISSLLSPSFTTIRIATPPPIQSVSIWIFYNSEALLNALLVYFLSLFQTPRRWWRYSRQH